MPEESLSIEYGDKTIAAKVQIPHNPTGIGFMITHGAGGDMDNAQIREITNYLTDKGIVCLRFTCKGLNIKYRIKVYKQVLSHFYETREKYGITSVILSGRSMGSRAALGAANELQAEQESRDLYSFICGAVCLSYPLHPPGNHSNLRDEAVLEARVPVMFVSGTRDEMCDRELMTTTLDNMQGGACPQITYNEADNSDDKHPRYESSRMLWLRELNHSLTPRKKDAIDMLKVYNMVEEWCILMCTDDKENSTAAAIKPSSPADSASRQQAEPDSKRNKQRATKGSKKQQAQAGNNSKQQPTKGQKRKPATGKAATSSKKRKN